jgi:hypothetical protein
MGLRRGIPAAHGPANDPKPDTMPTVAGFASFQLGVGPRAS